MRLCVDGVQRQGQVCSPKVDAKSQADFAKKLGVAYSTINEWENGVRHPNYIMQRKFAAFCEENDIVFKD